MTDNITLPREVVERLVATWDWDAETLIGHRMKIMSELVDNLRTHLAAPRLEVTVDPRLTSEEAAAISAAIDARKKEQSEDIEALRRDAEKWRSFAAAATELRRLYTEIAWLKAANRELGDVVMDYKAGAQALSAKNAILHAELEALRRDAERYRYLRNRDPKEVFNKSGKAAGVWIDWEDDLSGLQLLTGDDADTAIDAAMGDKT